MSTYQKKAVNHFQIFFNLYKQKSRINQQQKELQVRMQDIYLFLQFLTLSWVNLQQILLIMSFFSKGDFKIDQSWQKKPPSRMTNSRSKEKIKNNSLVNAGKNIIYEPNPDILDDELSKRILKDFASEMTPPIPTNKTEKKVPPKEDNTVKLPPRQKVNNPTAPHSENDLLTTMAARLKTVEITCKNQRQQLREKMETLEKIKSENTFLKNYRDNATQEYQKMKNLQAENEQLKKKVEEMQVYLKKYGLKWVGNKKEGNLQHEKMKKDISKGNYQYRLPSQIDLNTIIRRAEQLNSGLHSEGMGTQIYSVNGVHKFRKAQGLPMGFFSNGIAIKGYKFFPYKSKQSLQILSDLVDGYFPYILKGKYPNGVFLKVVDKISQQYVNQSSDETINTFQSKDNNDFRPPSKEEFLNKLPKQIIKNGKVINIRGQIQKRLNGQVENEIKQQKQQQEDNIISQSERGLMFKTQEYERIEKNQINEDSVCQLKIRNQEGKIYILLLQKEKLMKDVYLWMGKVAKSSFKVMSNFPRRSYEINESENLDNLGFYPNAMLHIQSSASK